MPDLRPEDRWQLLLDKSRRGPFGWINRGPFFSRPTLSSRRGIFSIGESRGLRWMGVVFWPTFVVPLYVAFWTLGDGIIPFAARLVRSGPVGDACFVIGILVFNYAFAALALIVPPLLLLRQRCMRWETIGRYVTVEWGYLFNPVKLVFDRRELKAVSTTTDQLGDYPFPSGAAALVLQHAWLPGEVFLAHASTASVLLPAFHALAEFLPGSRDATLAETALADGSAFAVSRAAHGAGYSRLRFRGPRVAEFSPSVGSYFTTLVVLCFGALFLWLGTGSGVIAVRSVAKAGPYGESLVSGLMAVMFFFSAALCLPLGALVVGAVLAAFLVAPRDTIDLDRREYCSRRKLLDLVDLARWRRRIPLADVAGLQICSQNYERKTLPQRLPYELNLVLRQPAGERITLLHAHGREKINRLARRLGEFLDLPVWDHAEKSDLSEAA